MPSSSSSASVRPSPVRVEYDREGHLHRPGGIARQILDFGGHGDHAVGQRSLRHAQDVTDGGRAGKRDPIRLNRKRVRIDPRFEIAVGDLHLGRFGVDGGALRGEIDAECRRRRIHREMHLVGIGEVSREVLDRDRERRVSVG